MSLVGAASYWRGSRGQPIGHGSGGSKCQGRWCVNRGFGDSDSCQSWDRRGTARPRTSVPSMWQQWEAGGNETRHGVGCRTGLWSPGPGPWGLGRGEKASFCAEWTVGRRGFCGVLAVAAGNPEQGGTLGGKRWPDSGCLWEIWCSL